MEPWKRIVCSSEECAREALNANGKVKEDYYLYPDFEDVSTTQFLCPRCGRVEAWGPTRRKVQQFLYERLQRKGQVG